jgi:hypothetical protein
MGLRACCVGVMLVLTACGGGGSSADTGGATGAAKWFTYERAEDYPGVVQQTGAKIAMDDGVQLSATVTLPADADGNAVATPLPVILTQTGYNKSIPAIPAYNEFLVRHGYVHVSVDVRGTGLSEGDWEAFSEREQADYAQVMDWVATQPWSNGTVGTWGASFMGITQIFTAAHQHPAHKAVFAIVPMADGYRDIVFTGGQTNVGFIPLWMGLVTALGAIPAEPDPAAPEIIADHIINALTNFQVPVIAQSVIGTGEYNYDGPFWRTRSPIEVADRVRIPTFIVGGLNDIFQRGEPLLYEAISRNTTAKLLIGPWQHLGGSSGEGLPRDDVPDLDHIALMWFDQYLKGMDAAAASVPNVTQYLYGEERYVTTTTWPHPQAAAQRWYLRGDQSLTTELPAADEGSNTVLQQPLNGLCSTSTSQWTAGILGTLPLPCFTDNSTNENPLLEVTFTTAPMAQDYIVNGPIQADMWISTTMLDASLLVRITDVSPEGGSREITNGILTASLRQVDPARSRYLDGQMIQPWHPFTEDSREEVGMDTPVLLPIEVFPSSFVIKEGHSLRVSVGASDFPHGLPPLTDLVDQAVGALTVYSDAQRASSIVVPAVPLSAITAAD